MTYHLFHCIDLDSVYNVSAWKVLRLLRIWTQTIINNKHCEWETCFVWYLLSCYKQSSSKPLLAAMFVFWQLLSQSSYIYPQWLNYQHMMVKWILIQFTFYCCQIKPFTRVNVYYILFWCRNHSILVFYKGCVFWRQFWRLFLSYSFEGILLNI